MLAVGCAFFSAPFSPFGNPNPHATTIATVVVVGFAVRAAGRLKLLVANLEAAPKSVRIEGVAGPARLQRLSDETAPGRSTHMQVDEVSALELAPFEIIRIDA